MVWEISKKKLEAFKYSLIIILEEVLVLYNNSKIAHLIITWNNLSRWDKIRSSLKWVSSSSVIRSLLSIVPFTISLINFLNLCFGNVKSSSLLNNFIYIFNQLENNNFPINEIKNYYYFQIGRWDLQLVNNKIIKFPNNNTEDAIEESIELLNREDFKNYNIIDLRVDGKIIVE